MGAVTAVLKVITDLFGKLLPYLSGWYVGKKQAEVKSLERDNETLEMQFEEERDRPKSRDDLTDRMRDGKF